MTPDIASDKDFADEHAMLCAVELPKARHDAERLTAMLSALVEVLGLVIAVGSGGDAAKANELAEGVTARIFEAATENAGVAALVQGRAHD